MATSNKATHSQPSGASSGQIAIPGDRCNPSDDAGEPRLQAAGASSSEITSVSTFALSCDGEITFEEDTDSNDWEDICSRDFAIFRPGTKQSEVASYLDALDIKGDHKAEILEQIFC